MVPRAGRPWQAGDEDAPTLSTPTLEGKVKVQLGEGEEIEVEAAAYMEELKTEAQACLPRRP